MTPEELENRTVGVQLKDLEYRRQKQWDIFSWSSTVLLSITGGVFALATRTTSLAWPTWEKGVISFSALTIAVFAQSWIHYHWQYELALLEALCKSASFPIFRKKTPVGYPHVLAALTLAALLAIWCPLRN
jgi:hypothetical protein